MKYQLLLLLQLVLFGQLFAQDIPPNAEPGKCYAKCLIQVKPEIELIDFYTYTGIETDIKGLDTLYFRYDKQDEIERVGWYTLRSDLTKKRYKKLRYDHKEIIVLDTTEVKEFKLNTFEIDNSTEEANTEWREVICGAKVNKKFALMLNEALVQKGFLDVNESSNVIGAASKKALTEYQKASGLPVGQLDLRTIESLGIENNNYLREM